MQNNSIFLELVAKLNIFGFNRSFKKILITARRLLKVVLSILTCFETFIKAFSNPQVFFYVSLPLHSSFITRIARRDFEVLTLNDLPGHITPLFNRCDHSIRHEFLVSLVDKIHSDYCFTHIDKVLTFPHHVHITEIFIENINAPHSAYYLFVTVTK
jgi:hypothetical protein